MGTPLTNEIGKTSGMGNTVIDDGLVKEHMSLGMTVITCLILEQSTEFFFCNTADSYERTK